MRPLQSRGAFGLEIHACSLQNPHKKQVNSTLASLRMRCNELYAAY